MLLTIFQITDLRVSILQFFTDFHIWEMILEGL